jgi:hypothetical protein
MQNNGNGNGGGVVSASTAVGQSPQQFFNNRPFPYFLESSLFHENNKYEDIGGKLF